MRTLATILVIALIAVGATACMAVFVKPGSMMQMSGLTTNDQAALADATCEAVGGVTVLRPKGVACISTTALVPDD